VHVDDVCASIDLALHALTFRSRVFNISVDEMHTLAQCADVVRRVTGELDVTFDETLDLPNYRIGKLSIRRARDELGYAPRLPLQVGVREYWLSTFHAGS